MEGIGGIDREDLERMIFFEQAKEEAEKDVRENPKDASALTRLGGAMLELAHFRQGQEAFECIEQAIKKLDVALDVDEKKHEALWCKGNAYTSLGFLTADTEQAYEYFEQAGETFTRAQKQDPENETYKKAAEMTRRAPSLHAELQKQLAAPGGLGGGRETGQASASSSDFWYDLAGWGILIGIGIAWVSLARTEQAGAASAMK